MPELPDIVTYVEALERHVRGKALEKLRLASPFLVRSFDPPISALEGLTVRGVERLGKRLVLAFDDDLYLVLHLMIAGRLRWKAPGIKVPRRNGLAAFDFADGSLLLTEASSKKRAKLHVVRGRDGVAEHDPGGLELADADLPTFRARLEQVNHTLKRALTDPRILSGIGNAYSDEILHRARLSPFRQTQKLDDDGYQSLFDATHQVLDEWTQRFRSEIGDGFPDKVTAFRPEMAVHGKFGQPCPRCGQPVQRLVYAENEANYCAECQTGGRLLADRALSRLLKKDWPKTVDQLEAFKAERQQ